MLLIITLLLAIVVLATTLAHLVQVLQVLRPPAQDGEVLRLLLRQVPIAWALLTLIRLQLTETTGWGESLLLWNTARLPAGMTGLDRLVLPVGGCPIAGAVVVMDVVVSQETEVPTRCSVRNFFVDKRQGYASRIRACFLVVLISSVQVLIQKSIYTSHDLHIYLPLLQY